MSDATFDYIIIGGGTAGALLCNRLSADARHRVLLLEAGPRDDYHWIHIPVGYLYCIGNPRTDWLYNTRCRRRLHPARIAPASWCRCPTGRVLCMTCWCHSRRMVCP